jgi:hypothetical protein
LGKEIVDGPELEEVSRLVVAELETWSDTPRAVTPLDSDYMPLAGSSGRPGE